MIDKIIEFKQAYLQEEFNAVNVMLKTIVFALAGFSYYNFGKALLITEVLRNQKMQDEYYKTDPKYKSSPWTSVHQYGRGIDISIKYHTSEEIEQMYNFINKHFVYGGTLQVALIHDVGFGKHLHLQTPAAECMVLKK